jgi:membrane protein DedA with SNARE-associated domain
VSVYGVAAAAIVGTILGNTTGYWLGRFWGGPLLAWRPLVWLIGGTIAKARDFMERRGEWAIVLSRLSSFSRILVPFLAGASRLSYRRFIVFDLPSGAAWATIWVFIGFLLGESWRALMDRAGAAAFLVLILVVTALLIRWVAMRIASNQRRILAAWRLALRATGLTGVAHALAPFMHWSGRRLNPRLALGLSLTLGFGVVILAAGAVGLVFSQTQAVRGLALIDFPVLEWMGATRTDEAVSIARAGLRAFHWPGMFGLVIAVVALVGWKAGGPPAARAAVGILGAGLGAYFLDRMVLEGIVPRAEFPSVPVAVVAALLVHATAVAGSVRGWGAGVTAAAVGAFLTCTVALGTIVAGWAAPSGIALGFAIGLGWASLLEVQGMILGAAWGDGGDAGDAEPDSEGAAGPAPADQPVEAAPLDPPELPAPTDQPEDPAPADPPEGRAPRDPDPPAPAEA